MIELESNYKANINLYSPRAKVGTSKRYKLFGLLNFVFKLKVFKRRSPSLGSSSAALHEKHTGYDIYHTVLQSAA